MNGVMVPPEGNIYDILNGNASFESYLGYAKTAGIQRFLQNTSPMTRECISTINEIVALLQQNNTKTRRPLFDLIFN